MFAWMSREKQVDSGEETFIDAPETPAPVFAVRALKHAIWGTPVPNAQEKTGLAEGTANSLGEAEDTIQKSPEMAAQPGSPTKPSGILMTPGTAAARRKQVTFGTQVVDNEGKKSLFGRSGIPHNCPGKFPSPWTPRIADHTYEHHVISETKTKSGQRAARTGVVEPAPIKVNAEASKNPKDNDAVAGQGKVVKTMKSARAKDDIDVTIDILTPRSESGRYWKHQYMTYSAASEEEVRKLIAKAKLAKEYARQKDNEALELRSQLETERQKRATRERILEGQIKDLRERLRQALSENAKSNTELATLRHKIDARSEQPPTVSPVDASAHDLAANLDVLWSEALADRIDKPHLSQRLPERDEQPKRVGVPRSPANGRGVAVAAHGRKRMYNPSSRSSRQSKGDYKTPATEDSTFLEFSRTQLSPIKGSPALPSPLVLRERGPNDLNVQPAVSHSADLPKTWIRDDDEDVFRDIISRSTHFFDASAPLEALAAQAEQPVTPTNEMRKKTGSSHAKKSETAQGITDSRKRKHVQPRMAADRVNDAKARIAARRKLATTRNGPIR